MRKLQTLLIAFLCAVTTIVTLGAVNSFTAKADEETTEYAYQDTSVTGIEKASDTRLGFVVSGSDYLGVSQYSNGKNYTNINGLNTLKKIKIDGEAIADEAWDGAKTDPYINLWTRASFVFQQQAFATATEITVEAGCEFPSYALWSGEGNVVYRTTEDVTFVKNNEKWIKKINYTYADTYAASVSINETADDWKVFPRIELIYTDYKKSNGSFNNKNNYDVLYGLNTFTKINIDGNAAGTVYEKAIDPYLNMFDNGTDRFAFKYENFPNATEVVIEEGCEFPSYALWSGNGTLVYRIAETATFNKVDGVWVKQVSDTLSYRDTSVTSFSTISGWDEMGYYWFHLSENDYAKASNNYKNGGVYTSINGLNTLSYIKIDGTAVGGEWSASDPYIHHYSEDSFTFKSEAFKTATEVTIEAGCEFPSYARWGAGASFVYRTTETVTFRKVGDAWYKVYTATFVDEEGNKLGESTFTTADAALTYPNYDADPAYDYAWTGNEIKAENITVTLTKTIKTFDVKIGDGAAEKIEYGAKLMKPETDPEKAADAEYTYTFAGWYNGETAWNFETDVVTGNVTLTAKFDSVKKQTESNSGDSSDSGESETGATGSETGSETSGETGGESGSGADSSSGSGGCFGSVASGLPFVSILLLAGAVIIKTKKKD